MTPLCCSRPCSWNCWLGEFWRCEPTILPELWPYQASSISYFYRVECSSPGELCVTRIPGWGTFPWFARTLLFHTSASVWIYRTTCLSFKTVCPSSSNRKIKGRVMTFFCCWKPAFCSFSNSGISVLFPVFLFLEHDLPFVWFDFCRFLGAKLCS